MTDTTIEGFELSPAQERLWRLQAADPEAYRAQGVVRLEGRLDVRRLRRALGRVVARHEALRTCYRALPGIELPLQVIAEPAPPEWRHLDLGAVGGGDAAAPRAGSALDALCRAEAGRPFDLAAGTPVRLALVTLSPRQARLVVTLPALNADGESLRNLVAEVARAYAEDGVGAGDDGVVQYVDVAQWHNELLASEEAEAAAEHWSAQGAAGFERARLPFEAERGGAGGFRPASITGGLPRELSARVDALASAQGASAAAVLLAAWQLLLRRLTAAPETLVGSLADGRRIEQLREALGLYGRYLPIPLRASDDFRFSEVVRRLDKGLRAAYEKQESFSWRAFSAADTEAPSGPCAFPYLFDLSEVGAEHRADGLRLRLERGSWLGERFSIRLSAVRGEDGYALEWHYDAVLHDTAEVRRLAGRYRALLAAAAAGPGSAIGELDGLSEAERDELATWNQTRRPVPQERSLAELFEARVASLPAEATAVVWEGGELSFRELEARAGRLARRLRALAVAAESPVALYLERSVEQVVAVLGALKAGAAYLPLDPDQPPERWLRMLDDSGARVVLCRAAHEADLGSGRRWLSLADEGGDEAPEDEAPRGPLGAADPGNLAYVIYTSGSTGRPKGTLIEQRSVKSLARALEEAVYHDLPADPSVRVSLNAPLSFDASVKQLVQLLHGRSLAIVPNEVRPDGEALLAWLERHRVDVLDCTPSQLRLLLEAGLGGPAGPRFPRRVLVGGEAIGGELWRRLAEDPERRFYNLYGPTECTVDATCERVAEPSTPTLGRPLANVAVRVIDARGRQLPVGVAGELAIGGAGVGRGYLGRPGLTAERFVPDPLAAEPGARRYRTGDRARFLADGRLESLGRLDGQVKLRGVRLELGEVEAALREHPGVGEAVAVLREEAAGPRLVAYAVPERRYAALLEAGRHATLPGPLRVVHQNRNETTYLYEEIFAKRSYLRHGIALPDDACVFDVGANVGMFSLFVQQECARPRIYAFEPLAPIFEVLEINCALYATPAKLFGFGLSDRERSERFSYYPRYSMMSSQLGYARPESEKAVVKRFLANELEGGSEAAAELLGAADELLAGRFEAEVLEAPLRRLSDVVRAEGVERIDLLKVDVQRAELDVLRGIDEADWPRIDQVVMEVHDAPGEETEGRLVLLTRWLEERGFRVAVEQDPLLEGTDRYNLYALHPRAAERRPAGREHGSRERRPPEGLPLEVAPGALREMLQRRLPEVMVPAAVVVLEKLPLNANGKVDRRALPAPEEVEGTGERTLEAPRTPTEELLAGIWAQLLGRERVGVGESFFELGGHSLLATQLMSRVRALFEVELPLRALFEKPTVEALAAEVEAAMRAGGGLVAPPIVPVPRSGPGAGELPLSFAQQRLWFLQELVPGDPFYNSARAIRLRGALSASVVVATLREVVRRHEVLRTRFRHTEAGAVQEVRPAAEWRARAVDLAALDAVGREAEVRRLARAEARRPFDLGRDLPLRATLVRLGRDDHALFFTVHHVAADGWSLGVLVREIAALYRAFAAGRPSPLPELPIQVADFAAWQRGWLRGEVLEGFLAYWRRRLGGELPVLRLPADRPRSAAPRHRGAQSAFDLPPELSAELAELSRRRGATLFMTTLAAFTALLSRLSEQDDLIVGTAIAGRNRAETEDLIGFFINMLPLRLDLSGDPTFLELLEQVRQVALGAYAHQDVPFDKLVEELQPARGSSRAPIFQVAFSLRNVGHQALELPGLEIEPMEVVHDTARFDLTVWVGEIADGLSVTWYYDVDLFDAETIERLERRYETLLASAVADPEARVASLRIVGESEQREREAARQGREAANLAKLRGARRRRVGGAR